MRNLNRIVIIGARAAGFTTVEADGNFHGLSLMSLNRQFR